MLDDFRWPEPTGPAQQKLVDDVKEYGCHILNVAGDNRPDFSYSVGLFANFGHPEITISGLPAEKAAQLINLACDRIRQGANFADGTVSAELTRGASLALSPSQVSTTPTASGSLAGFTVL